MTIPDHIKELIERGELPCLIMGNEFWDLELISLRDGKEWKPPAHGRPIECLGALALIEGVVRSALVAPFDVRAVNLIGEWYAAYVQEANREAAAQSECVGDEVAWLHALWALPDPRV
jgi:hypothetical protein